MTTGMSAPPIAATRWKPRNRLSSVKMISASFYDQVFWNQTPQAMMPTIVARFSRAGGRQAWAARRGPPLACPSGHD